MSHTINTHVAEELLEARAAWLFDEGYQEKDVMENEYGEYVISEVEAEDCTLRKSKVYLPLELTKNSINSY